MLSSELAASWPLREHRLRNGSNLDASIWTNSESVWVMLPLNTVIFLCADGQREPLQVLNGLTAVHNLTHVGLWD